MASEAPFPAENYFRVSLKALIFDDNKRLLLFKDIKGEWEIPGGGWDHGEDYKACIVRELAEEASVKVAEIGDLAFFYRCQTLNGHPKIALAFPVALASHTFVLEQGLAEARFVTKQEFKQLLFQQGEEFVLPYADQIWQLVEKNS